MDGRRKGGREGEGRRERERRASLYNEVLVAVIETSWSTNGQWAVKWAIEWVSWYCESPSQAGDWQGVSGPVHPHSGQSISLWWVKGQLYAEVSRCRHTQKSRLTKCLRALRTLVKLTHTVSHPHLPHVNASSAPRILSYVKSPPDWRSMVQILPDHVSDLKFKFNI